MPEKYDAAQEYPAVLFLHGGAGRGADNERHLQGGNGMLIEMLLESAALRPAFVIAPQTTDQHHVAGTLKVIEAVKA